MKENMIIGSIILISMMCGLIVMQFDLNNAQLKHKELRSLDVSFEDSLFVEIKFIIYDGYLKCYVANDSMSWCGGYDNFLDKSYENLFNNNVYNFKILSKKANNDTLITIDRNRQVRYYNIRSGPCYDSNEDRNTNVN